MSFGAKNLDKNFGVIKPSKVVLDADGNRRPPTIFGGTKKPDPPQIKDVESENDESEDVEEKDPETDSESSD